GLSVIANNQSKTYGAADPALTFAASGFQFNDTGTVLTGALARAAGENVGNYAIGQGTLAANANYTIAFTPGTLRIDPAMLAVIAANQSKTYGAADPALTFSASGFKFADTAASVLTGALVRAPGENVSNYAITQGTLAANANYRVAFPPGTLRIAPAGLSVIAANQSKTYGAA